MVRLFNHWFASNTLLQVVFDAILLFLSVVLAVVFLDRGQITSLEAVVPDALLFALTMVALNTVVGLYQRNPGRTMAQTTARIVLSLLLAVPVAWSIFTFLPRAAAWDQTLRLAVPLAFVAFVAIRAIAAHSGMSPMFARRTLVLGTGVEAVGVEQSIGHLGQAVKFLGFFPAKKTDAAHQVAGTRVLGSGMDLVDAARRYKVDEIIVAVRERRGGVLPLRELLDCKLMGVRVLDLSSYYERAVGQLRLDSLHASWLIFGDGFRQGFTRTFVKRIFDIGAAMTLLVLASPVMLLTCVAIALENGFPIIYRQERVGQGGRLFNVIKFRSMRRDAEIDGKPRWAVNNDDRVTRIGRVIRKVRIDELPQLINVLRGDMSLVGPRPERPYFVDQLAREIPYYAVRHSVKPGVTGWAQVRYHYSASLEDAVQKLQFDLYYVKNHTLFLDIVILFETVGVVMTGEGAQ
ncbi:MAG: TIGR03013 family XrtA/PEP-CTERM system glycosyltransferase [Betaproteobacteria bacterium]